MNRVLAILLLCSAWLGAGQSSLQQHLDAAKKAEAAGDFARAEREYEKSLALRRDAETLQRLGLVRHLQNKFAEAIPAFEGSIRLRPDSWSSRLFLGIDYYRTNQFGKALPHLTRALQLKPADPETRFWLGVTYLALNRHMEGLTMLEEALRQQPENAELLRVLAQNYSDYAVLLLNRIAEKHPETALGRQIHGQALENEGALEDALREYRAAVALQPALEGSHQAIGRILWTQGKTQEAARELEKELALQPQEPESHFYLGQYAALSQQPREAVAHLETASLWTQDSATPAATLAKLLLEIGEINKAADAVARAVELAPASEEIHTLSLAAYEKAGKPDGVAREKARWEKVKSRQQ